MPLPDQTGHQRHYVLGLSIRPSVHPFISCQHGILKMSEPIVMQIIASVLRDKCMIVIQSTLGIRMLKVKVIQGQNTVWVIKNRPPPYI